MGEGNDCGNGELVVRCEGYQLEKSRKMKLENIRISWKCVI